MNKKVFKVLATILMIMFIVSIAVTSFALTPNQIVASGNVTGSKEITSLGKSIVGILRTVGVVLSVVVLIIIGIKYMMGSAEEKAEYKKTLMPYVIGAALVFAASAIAGIVFSFTQGLSGQ